MVVNIGFKQKRTSNKTLPPGQYETHDFPVLSKGPTPMVDTNDWSLKVSGLVEQPLHWDWESFSKLPNMEVTKDIHCVTKWSKLDTKWTGVSLDVIMKLVNPKNSATHILAFSSDGYSTNLPRIDISEGKAWIATAYDGAEIPPEHGGPVRLLIPHLYFWKSAKWLDEIKFVDHDEPGFWETRGYHMYGDPWKEQRYTHD